MKALRFLDPFIPYLWVIAILLIAFGTALILLTPRLNGLFDPRAADRDAAEAQVRAMYDAIAANDGDALMDCMLPANRRQPSPMGLLTLFDFSGEGSTFPWWVRSASGLLEVMPRDLEFTVIEQSSDYMLIEARGKLRQTALRFEVDYCDRHDLRRDGEKWYVDIYAPDHQKRVTAALERHLGNLATGATGVDKVIAYLMALFKGDETALNFCN